jgi:hypothetical protein
MAKSGTSGSWSGKDKDTFRAALDGDTSTFLDAPEPNGAYVQVDTGQGTPFGTRPGHEQLTVTVADGKFGVGTGDHLPGKRVGVNIYYVPEGQYFAGWEGFTSILDDRSARFTTATIPGIGTDLWVKATFKPLPPGTHALDVTGGSGDGIYPAGTMVTVSADPLQPASSLPAGRGILPSSPIHAWPPQRQ